MEQITQNLKSGHMEIMEVPFPVLQSGQILVRNHYSLISAGTEGKTVKDARLGYVGKALARKEEVKKVMKSVKSIGLKDTYRLTMNKLDSPSALGYSCAGEVIAVADDVSEFKVGDFVACAGAGAVHAEVVAVPKNLCAVFPKGVSAEEGTYATLGAIALQGIRQSDLKLGESCAVVGLGLIGQLTLQLLNAAGIKAIAIDIDEKVIEYSRKSGSENVFYSGDESLPVSIRNLSNGFGVDAVIITASASSTDPVNLAGEICRPKGKVVIVGNVPTGFDRKNYYRKELDLRMSCSYGPGRYDAHYEEQGQDYPYAYVRWTEQRNMQAFLDLVSERKIDLKKITTHVYNFSEATKAYQMILDRRETFVGVLLKYDTGKELKRRVELKENKASASKVHAALIGAGSFATNVILPALEGQCSFSGIVTGKPNQAKHIANKYGFAFCSDNAGEIFSDQKTNTVFIASRHHSHAEYVLKALSANKNVFVEKPLCLTEEELMTISEAYKNASSILMVGFNRRFAPLIQKAKKIFGEVKSPLSMMYRINAGAVAKDHWTQDPQVGGGRILGELCHFIDLCAFMAGSKVKSVSAISVKTPDHLNDTVAVNLAFENGSVASISYFANGSKEMEKEYLEIFGGGKSLQIHDFKELRIFGRSSSKQSGKQDKGHQAEFTEFIGAIDKGNASPIPFDEIYNSTLATIKTLESVKQQGLLISL